MKLARLCLLIALVTALGLPALPAAMVPAAMAHGVGVAAAAATHASMDCPTHGEQTRSGQPKPLQHSSGKPDCCATALCAMAVGLPAVALAPMAVTFGDRGKYAVLALPRPVGIDPPPTTQPPKSAA